MTVAIDASAILAVVLNEEGSSAVLPHLGHGVVSSVNHAEVLSRLAMLGMPLVVAVSLIDHLRVEIVPFTADHAVAVGELRASTVSAGLSIGDRACLALARDLGIAALTADRSWLTVDVGVEVTLIR